MLFIIDYEEHKKYFKNRLRYYSPSGMIQNIPVYDQQENNKQSSKSKLNVRHAS